MLPNTDCPKAKDSVVKLVMNIVQGCWTLVSNLMVDFVY